MKSQTAWQPASTQASASGFANWEALPTYQLTVTQKVGSFKKE